jgi:hypothetical protein
MPRTIIVCEICRCKEERKERARYCLRCQYDLMQKNAALSRQNLQERRERTRKPEAK